MKKLLCMLLVFCLLLCSTGCGKEEAPAELPKEVPEETPQEQVPDWMTLPADRELTAKQYFVYDCETGEFVTISGDAGERVYPASITKLFTAYVAGQYLAADRTVTVGDGLLDQLGWGSSVAELQNADRITVEDLIAGMMLPSGNDAAYVLAEAAGHALAEEGESTGVQAFVAEMNRQAKLLGMQDTHFANPDGLHQEEHYSSLRDLAVLGTLALEDPLLLRYAGTAHASVQLASGTKQWKNTNALIDPESPYYCPYALGLKTGQTPSAGSCLLSAFEYEGRTLVIGVFGCPEEDDRFPDTLQLFNRTIGYTGGQTDAAEE